MFYDSEGTSTDYAAWLNGAGTVLQGAAPYLGAIISVTNPISGAPSVGTDAPIAPAPGASSPSGTPAGTPSASPVPGVTPPASGKSNTKTIVLAVVGIAALFVLFAPKGKAAS